MKFLPEVFKNLIYIKESLYIDFPFVNSYYDSLLSSSLFFLITALLLFSFVHQLILKYNLLGGFKAMLINSQDFYSAYVVMKRGAKAYSVGGFTLIELLVVIAILAALALISFAAFRGLSGKGNDSRRAADVKAVADAYETKRASQTNYGNLSLAADDFSGGAIPTDPISTRKYCIKTSTSAVVPNATISATDGITSAGLCVGTWSIVSSTALALNSTYFKICAAKEDTSVATNVFCAGSRQ